MQNAGIAALGLNWRYLAFEVRPDDLQAVINGAKAMGFVGLNLTVPHKLLAMKMVDGLDESAKTWGAVNTIRFEGQDAKGDWRALHDLAEGAAIKVRSRGFNTDADAIVRSLREDLAVEVTRAKIILLGAGGAGRAAALRLAAEGAGEMFLVNRTMSKAEEVAAEIRQKFPRVKATVGYPKSGAMALDLLINATSLGLQAGDGLPLDEAKFALGRVRSVYDMIYRPAETPLLKAAKAAGCQTANGLGMLLYQGAQALEIWTGRTAPVKIMREALAKNIYGN